MYVPNPAGGCLQLNGTQQSTKGDIYNLSLSLSGTCRRDGLAKWNTIAECQNKLS